MECVPGSLRAACQISVKSVMSALHCLFVNVYVGPLYHVTIFSLHCNAHTASASNCNITSCLLLER